MLTVPAGTDFFLIYFLLPVPCTDSLNSLAEALADSFKLI